MARESEYLKKFLLGGDSAESHTIFLPKVSLKHYSTSREAVSLTMARLRATRYGCYSIGAIKLHTEADRLAKAAINCSCRGRSFSSKSWTIK